MIESKPQTATKLFSFREPETYSSPIQKKTTPPKSFFVGSAEGLKATLSTAMTSKTTATAYSESSADRFASSHQDSDYNKIKKHTSSEAKPIKISKLLDVHRERES